MEKRENNFNMLQFMAAIMVLAGHIAVWSRNTAPIVLRQPINSLGVRIFFLIGGYLIATSWILDSNPRTYAIKRFIRICPPIIYILFYCCNCDRTNIIMATFGRVL